MAAAVAAFASVSHAWLPGHKIRGVNVGTMFVFEPWMDHQEWSRIGCEGHNSEFDCVMKTGQERADKAFQDHYANWIKEDDLDQMASNGLNTIRIPLGYWLKDDLVDAKSEHFPKGALQYLTRLCGWASARNFYIIIDLHGAPGAQQPNQPFTGQYAPSVGFYNDYNYGRAVKWLEWMTQLIHTKNEFRGVGMLEILNEPLNWDGAVESVRKTFYVNAYNAIRKVEANLGVAKDRQVHVQLMSSHWGSGKPDEFLPGAHFLAFDDHRYLKWDTSVKVDKDAFLAASCKDDRNAEKPTIIGEWSLSVPDNVEWTDPWNPNNNKDFYRRWFAAQVQAYEKSEGWVFWSWKVSLGDYRWSYKDAIEAGVIDKLDKVASSKVC